MSATCMSPLLANLSKVDQGVIFCATFDEKVRIFEILSKFLAKETPIKHFNNVLFMKSFEYIFFLPQ